MKSITPEKFSRLDPQALDRFNWVLIAGRVWPLPLWTRRIT